MNEHVLPGRGQARRLDLDRRRATSRVARVDTGDAYWLAPGEPLPRLDRDVRYRLTTADGSTHTVVAHLASDVGRLYLNARSPDRSQVYQDVQVFCPMTLEEDGLEAARACSSSASSTTGPTRPS